MESNNTIFIAVSAVLGLLVAVVWFGAPLLPAILGAAGAGALLYWVRQRRAR